MLQELGGHTQFDHFGENLVNIGRMLSEIFNGFFSGDTFFIWKRDTK